MITGVTGDPSRDGSPATDLMNPIGNERTADGILFRELE